MVVKDYVLALMLISKNTGARPEELLKLRWKDVEYEDVGRFSKTAQQENARANGSRYSF